MLNHFDVLDVRFKKWIIGFNQAMLSALTFLVTLLIVRDISADDFGLYVLVFTGITLCSTIFNALVIHPLGVVIPKYAFQCDGLELYSLNRYQFAVAISLGCVFLLIGTLVIYIYGDHLYYHVVLSGSVASIFQMTLMYLKHLLLANFQYTKCFLIDIVYVVIYLALLIFISSRDYGDVAYYFYALAFASLVGSLVSVTINSQIISSSEHKNEKLVSEVFSQGKWLVRTALVAWVRTNSALYISVFFLGPIAPAVIRVGQTIFGPLNTIYMALAYFVPQLGSKILHSEGHSAFNKFLRKLLFWISLPATLLVLIVYLNVQSILGFLSDTNEYSEYSIIVLIIGVQSIFLGWIEILNIGLRVIERAKEQFFIYLTEFGFTLIFGVVLVMHYDLVGLALWRVLSCITLLILLANVLSKYYTPERQVE